MSDVAGDASMGQVTLARPRILVVGCGDVGRRMAALLRGRYRLLATVRSDENAAAMRALGIEPVRADLDDPASLHRLGGLAPVVLHLAPPPAHGRVDTRTRHLVRALRDVRRLVYVSTSGVYGDCAGDVVDETRPVAPDNDRAIRRVDAEGQLRRWAIERRVRLTILRAPGIYASDRLPLERLRRGTPALQRADDVHTNHIHADDLARICAIAIHRGAPQRIYHAVDDSELTMGDWFDRVADTFGLDRPERLPRAAIEGRVSPALLSFMRESRRLANHRLHDELGVRLRYPTVAEGLAAAMADAKEKARAMRA